MAMQPEFLVRIDLHTITKNANEKNPESRDEN